MKKLAAFILAGTMLFSMGTNVFAAGETPNVNSNGQVPITKEFEMADGLKTPPVTFKFTATSDTPDALKATIQDVSYTAEDKGELLGETGTYVISKDTAISFEGNWKHAGEYVYTVKETKETVENVTYDEREYTLRVYVVNDENQLKVQQITAEGQDGKVNKIVFKNKYTKNNASLEIGKETVGAYADQTKKFNFKITFTKSPMSDQTTFIGMIGETPVECTAGVAKEFQLGHGEKLVFQRNLPVGTTYVVEEIGATDGYTPTVNVIENGTSTVINKTVKENEALDTLKDNNNNLVGENENKVTFTNTYKDVAVTGIVMNNLPFILLVAVALVAFVSLAVLKRRRMSRK